MKRKYTDNRSSNMNNNKHQNLYPVCGYIPENIIKEMKEATLASNEDKLERGFRICSKTKIIEEMNDKNTMIQEKCEGTERCMSISGKCPSNTKPMSFFHTHPKTRLTYPSIADKIHTDVHGYKFLCIGGIDHTKTTKAVIRCMPSDVPFISPGPTPVELQRFFQKWKEDVKDCIIDVR